LQGVEQVAQGVRDDDVVVTADYSRNGDHGVSDAFEDWDAVERLDRSLRAELPERHFKEKYREPTKHQADQVRYQKSAAAVLISQIRESPNVAKADCVADHGEHELDFVAPALAPWQRLNIFLFTRIIMYESNGKRARKIQSSDRYRPRGRVFDQCQLC
jgi:hypothetical protein